MPTSVLDKYNYPFPFFIKFDDIEYGMRRKDEEIILSNGFGVWHEDFDEKLHPYLEYYLFRNALVTNALHDNRALYRSVTRYRGKKAKLYFKRKYQELHMMDIAVKDFLKGPDFFFNNDIEKKNSEIREIASQKPNIARGIFLSPFIGVYYFFMLVRKYKRMIPLYKQAYDKLTSSSFWEGVFHNE